MNIQNGLVKISEFEVGETHLKNENAHSQIKQLLLSSLIKEVQEVNSLMILENIETGWSSVSEMFSIRQFVPFILGDKIKMKSKIFRVSGRRVFINSSISNEFEIVAEAREERKIVNVESFINMFNKNK